MSVPQQTLTGETTDEPRARPSTFVYCPDRDRQILRSRWNGPYAPPYETKEDYLNEKAKEEESSGRSDRVYNDDGLLEDEEEEEEPEVVGAEYRVQISYSVDFTANVTAANEDVAMEKLKDQIDFGSASSADKVWEDVDVTSEITRDELPDDWAWGDDIEEALQE